MIVGNKCVSSFDILENAADPRAFARKQFPSGIVDIERFTDNQLFLHAVIMRNAKNVPFSIRRSLSDSISADILSVTGIISTMYSLSEILDICDVNTIFESRYGREKTDKTLEELQCQLGKMLPSLLGTSQTSQSPTK